MKKTKNLANANFRSLLAATVVGSIIFLSSCSKEGSVTPFSTSGKANHQAAQNRVANNDGSMNLHLKLFLEGFYSGIGLMQSADGPDGSKVGLLNSLIIKEHNQEVYSADPADVDFVSVTFFKGDPDVELGHQVGYPQTGIVKVDGSLNIDNILEIPDGAYFLRINHRNTLETWSSEAVEMAKGQTTEFDFSVKEERAFGNNMIDVATSLGESTPVYAFFSGDISDASSGITGTQDGIVESQDLADMDNAVYITKIGYIAEDITGDGIAESADEAIMDNNVYSTRIVKRPLVIRENPNLP
jgi:hypothetical protein